MFQGCYVDSKDLENWRNKGQKAPIREMQIPTHREAAVLVALKQTETQHVYFNLCSIGMGFKKKPWFFFLLVWGLYGIEIQQLL